MPHRQLNNPYQGARYEYLVTFALSAVASVVPVPRPEDYGFDHLCTLTELVESSRYPRLSFGLQVKPKSNPILKYGGHTDKHEWKQWEITWLFGRDLPLILAVVDHDNWSIEFYSTWNVWHPYWMSRWPFEVWLRPDQVSVGEKEPKVPRRSQSEIANPDEGDGEHWDVHLGPAILKVNPSLLSEYESLMRECLKTWIELDMLNLLYRKLGIPWMYSISHWETNKTPTVGPEWWMFWEKHKPESGVPVQPKELLHTIAPMILALAKNYEAQSASDQLKRLHGLASILKEEGLIPEEMSNLFQGD